jgi:tetratricopeptide (TPR) repeat protein
VGSSANGPNVPASELGRLLDRITGSAGFRRSFRLQRFLRYVTEHAIDHPDRPLKEIEVAIAVFDKDASFDPRLDPIVRVEAGRLRLRLLEYYAGAGAEETIVIEIPLGRYLPNFRLALQARPPSVLNNEDPVARSLCLKGRYFWGKRTTADLAKAAEYFRRALAINSGYARAYLGLADCYAILGTFGFVPPREAYPRAKAAVTAALKIDPQLAEAHTTLATLSALYQWDRDAAEAGFRRVIDMRSGYAFAHHASRLATVRRGPSRFKNGRTTRATGADDRNPTRCGLICDWEKR